MRKRTKIALAVLIVGLIVLLAGFALADFDLTNLTTNGDMTQRQYEAEGDVTQLVVSDLNADVVITPSADGKARLTCWENEDLTYEISEENGVLRVEKHDGRFPPAAAQCSWKATRRALPPPLCPLKPPTAPSP